MADKRVAEVTLNSAGKAATLTLAPGWTFEGSAGPFQLTNVEHGHKIVKAATNPNAPSRGQRATQKKAQPDAQPSPDGAPYRPPEPSPAELKKIAPRRDIPEAFIYRVKMAGPGHDIFGWIRTTREIEEAEVANRARDLLTGALVHAKKDASKYRPSGKRWTVEDERAARKANDAGCPWPSVFRPSQSTAQDAPFSSEAGQ